MQQLGDYHKYVLPGVYDITVMANGYQTQTINGISVSANSSTATDFQLVPAEGQFVYKIRSSHIPNNNPVDIADTPGVIGEPDGRYYSIGKNGWIVVDMQYPIIDGPGNDLCVYEGDASPEGYTVFAGSTPDGPWVSLGNGLGTTEFDLSVAGIAEVQFLKILDDGDGVANVSGAGFDLDAIAALESLSGVYLALVDYFVDDSVGNNNGRLDPGETADIIVTIRNNGDIMSENVSGLISTTNPWISLDVDSFNFGDIQPLQTSEGIFTITANLLTPSGESFDLALAVNANAGAYTNNFTMSFVVGGYLIEEYFDSFPPAGWTTSGGSNWQGGTGNYAGGTAPEARFYWSPSTTAIQRLISHQINTTGSSTLQLEFKHNLDHYGGPYSIKVQTTSDGNTWNDAWSIVNPTGNIGPQLVEVEVSTPDVGSSTFQIAWVFDGYSWNLNNWYVDDVILGGGSAATFGTLSGIVTDGVSGLPLAGVSVNDYTTTGTTGNYTIDLIPGTYDITFSLDEYYDYTEENVEIIADETTTLNVSLTPIPTIDPPENFAGVVQNFNDVLLTWTIPGGTTQELYYHNGYDNNGIGTNRAADWICAARFTADELAAYYGTWELTGVNIFLHSMDFSYVGIQVYEGGSFGNPGTLVYDQDITTSAVALDFTNHLLSTPIPLVAGNEYWIGYEMSATGDHPAAVDAGPAVAGKGDWMYYSSIWQEISVAFGLNYNWVITGVVTESSDMAVNRPKQSKTIGTTARAQRNLAYSNAPMEVHHHRTARVTAPATETTRALTGYTIYRDGTEIGSVAAAILQYLDSGLNAGIYNYTIVANYDEGNSDPAGPVEVIVTLPAPTGVSVISNWPNVLVQWIPLSRALESYNIYQNDELVGNTTLNFIIITDVPAGIHSYNVAAVFSSGWEGDWSDTMILFHFDPVGADPNLIPLVTSLEGNYPNPFNPSTTIKFGLSESANVMLEIYNIRGEKVRTLINEELPAKYHSVSWNGRDDNNKSVSSGVYFYKMRAGNYVSTRKMILMK